MTAYTPWEPTSPPPPTHAAVTPQTPPAGAPAPAPAATPGCTVHAGQPLDSWCGCGHMVALHARRPGEHISCSVCEALELGLREASMIARRHPADLALSPEVRRRVRTHLDRLPESDPWPTVDQVVDALLDLLEAWSLTVDAEFDPERPAAIARPSNHRGAIEPRRKFTVIVTAPSAPVIGAAGLLDTGCARITVRSATDVTLDALSGIPAAYRTRNDGARWAAPITDAFPLQ